MKFIIASFVAFSFMGCAEKARVSPCQDNNPQDAHALFSQCKDNHVDVFLSEDFNDEQRNDLQESFDDWSEVTNNIVVFHLSYS